MPDSWELNQRFVRWSMNPIGSSDATDVSGKLTSVQLALAGETESSKDARSVCNPDWNMTFPVFRSAPSDGSPASPPRPFAAWYCA